MTVLVHHATSDAHAAVAFPDENDNDGDEFPTNKPSSINYFSSNLSDSTPEFETSSARLRRRSYKIKRNAIALAIDKSLDLCDNDHIENDPYKWSGMDCRVIPDHIFYKLAVRASSSFTSQRELIKRSTFILMCSLTVLAGMIWGVMYALLDEKIAAIMPFLYSAINGASLASCTIEGRYEMFVRIQLCLILLLPYTVHFALGGWQESGGVMLWSFLAPLGSVFFRSSSESLRWFQVYIVTSIAILLGGCVSIMDSISSTIPSALCGYWIMNIVGVTTIVYFAAFLFARELEIEYARSEELLHNILPVSIAKRIKAGELPIVDNLDSATILFADLVGFTKASAQMNPNILIGAFLRDVFSEFDRLVERRGLEKIKTIGDAYMVAAGLNGSSTENSHHAVEIMNIAAEMFQVMSKVNKRYDMQFEIRVGVHTGPVIAGVIGIKKFAYDVWGNTVNTASRMESHGMPGFIHLSQEMYNLVLDMPGFNIACRGQSSIKGLGLMTTYLAKPIPRRCSDILMW
eukprot:CAMPEP_0172487004 /NCGR_PEP_ID=MMETSP1066-20121228/15824_1 /TAXON_ID=671091 /ORGANISM="Coscinodiscus wailesii, Strain CCMP2513" /LENGTH=517 /DNA_ID=CAMNT_0013253325 /DNA_START=50 /DNA_END=1600 /DNA_ORIENTATION=-